MAVLESFIVTGIDSIYGYNVNSDTDLQFEITEPQSFSINNTQDNVDLTGKQGRVIGTLARNKGVTISGSNGLFDVGLLAANTGEEATTGNGFYQYVEYIEKKNITVSTFTAVSTVPGNEVPQVTVYVGDTSVVDKVLHQGATVSPGFYTYNPTTKRFVFDPTDITNGTMFRVIYNRYVNMTKVVNSAEVFGKTYHIIANCTGEDQCKNVKYIQFDIPYAKFDGNFNIEIGDSQSVQNFTARCEVDTCSIKNRGIFWTARFIDDGTPDVAYP